MAKGKKTAGSATNGLALGALDGIEPELRQLDGLITAFRILGEAGDAVETVAISSLARCARETLEGIERDWRTAIDALRAQS